MFYKFQNNYYKVWLKTARQVLQSEAELITKWDKYWKVWQEAITPCANYYRVRRNILSISENVDYNAVLYHAVS